MADTLARVDRTPARVMLLGSAHLLNASVSQELGVRADEGSALGDDGFMARIPSVGALWVDSATPITARELDVADELMVIAAYEGAGSVDLRAAADRGVAVFAARSPEADAAASLAMAAIVALAARVIEKNRLMHLGIWDGSAVGASDVRGMTLGIVGYDDAGRQLRLLAECHGMRVLVHDSNGRVGVDLDRAVRRDSLAKLLAEADVVSLHSDTERDRPAFFGEREFSAMKRGALFVHVCPGAMAGTTALARHLRSGHLGGAALDVFLREPGLRGEFHSDLRGLPNVLLTPRVGRPGAREDSGRARLLASKVRDFLETGSTDGALNLPWQSMPLRPGRYRMSVLYRDHSGALASINCVLAAHRQHVIAQSVQTDARLGYLLADSGCAPPHHLLADLHALPTTVRARTVFAPVRASGLGAGLRDQLA
jgi:D-3-phosphoglycerate dehydrogenase